ncbi:MAG: 8-amino-7-oxononanoate synthase [Gallionella sp.]|nr:8-amino-7-oxononanoate synthase [Gallionella sp.]MDD4958734.1 8-amino-7-oxononanoate synthase [Gallionella sp.]
MPFAALQSELRQRETQGLLRRRHTLDSPQSPHIIVAGKSYLTFSSNDYLGLANHPQLVAAWQTGAAQWGVGSGAAHLVTGHSAAHEELELALAQFVGKPAALLFSTGYMANAGAVQGLVGKADFVFADKLNHASLNEAMRLSRATVKRYRHNDVSHLAKLLADAPHGRKLVITDAVFSMDGDIAPLPELLALCEQHDAWLLVDDAHGFGVLGAQGRGALAHFGLTSPRIIYMATLGKAVGVFGAFVAAEQVVIDTLVNLAPSYVYTTATPPAVAHTTLASLRLIEAGDERRAHLQMLIALLREELQDLPWALMPSDTPIQPLLVEDAHTALTLSATLREQGIWLSAIRPPTVPTARLRITLSAAHTAADVSRLGKALHDIAR